jgi:hypothetical protein
MADARSEWEMTVYVFGPWRLNEVDGLSSNDGQTRTDKAEEQLEGETSVSSQNLPTVARLATALDMQGKRLLATIMQQAKGPLENMETSSSEVTQEPACLVLVSHTIAA